MTREEALVVLKANGLSAKDAQRSLDHMLIRVGFGSKTIDRTIATARTMDTPQLIRFFGIYGARAAIALTRT